MGGVGRHRGTARVGDHLAAVQLHRYGANAAALVLQLDGDLVGPCGRRMHHDPRRNGCCARSDRPWLRHDAQAQKACQETRLTVPLPERLQREDALTRDPPGGVEAGRYVSVDAARCVRHEPGGVMTHTVRTREHGIEDMQATYLGTGGVLPDASGAVDAAGNQLRPVGGPGNVLDHVVVALQRLLQLERRGVVHPHGAVPGDGGDPCTVRGEDHVGRLVLRVRVPPTVTHAREAGQLTA